MAGLQGERCGVREDGSSVHCVGGTQLAMVPCLSLQKVEGAKKGASIDRGGEAQSMPWIWRDGRACMWHGVDRDPHLPEVDNTCGWL